MSSNARELHNTRCKKRQGQHPNATNDDSDSSDRDADEDENGNSTDFEAPTVNWESDDAGDGSSGSEDDDSESDEEDDEPDADDAVGQDSTHSSWLGSFVACATQLLARIRCSLREFVRTIMVEQKLFRIECKRHTWQYSKLHLPALHYAAAAK